MTQFPLCLPTWGNCSHYSCGILVSFWLGPLTLKQVAVCSFSLFYFFLLEPVPWKSSIETQATPLSFLQISSNHSLQGFPWWKQRLFPLHEPHRQSRSRETSRNLEELELFEAQDQIGGGFVQNGGASLRKFALWGTSLIRWNENFERFQPDSVSPWGFFFPRENSSVPNELCWVLLWVHRLFLEPLNSASWFYSFHFLQFSQLDWYLALHRELFGEEVILFLGKALGPHIFL